MTRSEALTTFAALAVGRAIWHSQAHLPASLLGSVLTIDTNDRLSRTTLVTALASVDKEVSEFGAAPLTPAEFHAEVRRIACSTPDSDLAAFAMVESGTRVGLMGDIAPGKGN